MAGTLKKLFNFQSLKKKRGVKKKNNIFLGRDGCKNSSVVFLMVQ